MTHQLDSAVVKYLPETLTAGQQRLFFAEVEGSFTLDRPRIVLDCSRAGKVDKSAIHLLLCCLEEAMKRNGDVKLAAIPDGINQLLKETGADRLFEIFETTADALDSFHRSRPGVTPGFDLMEIP